MNNITQIGKQEDISKKTPKYFDIYHITSFFTSVCTSFVSEQNLKNLVPVLN